MWGMGALPPTPRPSLRADSASFSSSPIDPASGTPSKTPSSTGAPASRSNSRSPSTVFTRSTTATHTGSRSFTSSVSPSAPRAIVGAPGFVTFTVTIQLTVSVADMQATALPALLQAIATMVGADLAAIQATLLTDLATGQVYGISPATGRLRALRVLQSGGTGGAPGSGGYNAGLGVDTTAATPGSTAASPAAVAAAVTNGFTPPVSPALAFAAAQVAAALGGDPATMFGLASPPLFTPTPSQSASRSVSPVPSSSSSAAPTPSQAASPVVAAAQQATAAGASPAVVGGTIGAVLGFCLILACCVILFQWWGARRSKAEESRKTAASAPFIVPEHAAASAHARRISNLAAEWAVPPSYDEGRSSMASVDDVQPAVAPGTGRPAALLTDAPQGVGAPQPPLTGRSMGGGAAQQQQQPQTARSMNAWAALPGDSEPYAAPGAIGDTVTAPPPQAQQQPARVYLDM